MPASPPAQPAPDSARPLVATADPRLLDDLLRLAAAAGVEAQVAHDPAAVRRAWPEAPIVVVGADLAPPLARRPPARRDGVVLVGLDLDDAGGWERAVSIGAQHVVFLPDAQSWLTDRLADAAEGRSRSGDVVCVLGGRGGAGASTLAAALAVTAVRGGASASLIDADPLGGGLDLVLGGEDAAGLRWPELAGTRGRIDTRLLHDALPHVDGLTVLSWDRGDTLSVPVEAMEAVLGSASRGGDLVVVDLPRRLDAAAELALARCDVALVVVPAEVRATASAGRVSAAAAAFAQDLRVVVRGPSPSGLPAEVVAGALGLPLAGRMRAEPGIAGALERGEAPAQSGRGPLASFCRSFLAERAARGAAA